MPRLRLSHARRAVATLLSIGCAVAVHAQQPAPVAGAAAPAPAAPPAVNTVPGMPPVSNAANLYGDAVAGRMAAGVNGALSRVYVPNVSSNDVYVIDPATMQVIDKFKVGINPQHVVPSWDLSTLWVANNAEGRT